MKTIKKDITTVERGTIVHQVNCMGKMNSGVAKAIHNKWPRVYEQYDQSFSCEFPYSLGEIQVVEITPPWLYVVNLFGQSTYGFDRQRYTSYGAWEDALRLLKNHVDDVPDKTLYFPYNVGCDRGGGNFVIISEMIKEHFPDAIFCKI